MAIGYGSEFQLLRYLGHHRNYLNSKIQEVLKIEGDIKWFEYPVDENRDSMDGEYKGIECFEKRPDYERIKSAWKQFWPQRGKAQNWDGIFTIGEKYYFVEAKAHIDEAHQECQAGTDSRIIIKKAFEKTCKNKTLANKWLDSNCYQLANRLAFIHFCNENNIKADLVYICFYNGYRCNIKKNMDPDDGKWEIAMKKDFDTLELSNELKAMIHLVYIDCLKPDK